MRRTFDDLSESEILRVANLWKMKAGWKYIAEQFNISRWDVDRCRAYAVLPLRSRPVALDTRAGRYNAANGTGTVPMTRETKSHD